MMPGEAPLMLYVPGKQNVCDESILCDCFSSCVLAGNTPTLSVHDYDVSLGKEMKK